MKATHISLLFICFRFISLHFCLFVHSFRQHHWKHQRRLQQLWLKLCYHITVSVRPSVTLVYPAKALGRMRCYLAETFLWP